MTDDELFDVRKKFGLLFQDGALFGSMNIYDNVAFPLRQHTDKGEEEIGEIVNRRLKEVGLTEATYKMPNELSGGMRKRAGFARALVLEPAIVMFDEPDSGPRPGAHGAALRADPRGPRRERRLLPGDLPRPRHGAPDRRLHRRPVERQDRRVGTERGALRLQQPVRQPVPPRRRHRPALDGLGGARRRSSRLAELFARIAAWAARHARCGARGRAACSRSPPASGRPGSRPTPASAPWSTPTTPTYQATEHVREVFGEEPVVVLVRGELPQLLLTQNIFRLLRLEGCLSGKVPKGAKPLPGACTELAETRRGRVRQRPGDLPQRGGGPDRRPAASGSRNEVAPAELQEFLLAVATKYGITSLPSIDNEQFVATVVFDLARARGTPKARLAYLFPNSHTAQIVVRLKPDLSESERHRAIGLIEDLVAETTPRKRCAASTGGAAKPCFVLSKGSYVVSGAPVVVDGLARALKDALLLLFGVALVVMAVVLLLVFRSRLRLLPLAVAVAAAAIAFGLLGLASGSLTMASIAALPILIGLAVDYAIQFQARFDEAAEVGAGGVEAARLAALGGAPTIAAACLATAAGFLALQLSPTPMVRGFGWLLIVGVAIAFVLALTAGLRGAGARVGTETPPVRCRPEGDKRQAELGRRGRLPGSCAWRWTSRWRCSGSGLALAILGWGLGTRIETVSDIRELAPQSLPAVQELDEAAGSDRGLGRARRLDRSRRPRRPGDDRVDGRLQAPGPRARTASPAKTRAA